MALMTSSKYQKKMNAHAVTRVAFFESPSHRQCSRCVKNNLTSCVSLKNLVSHIVFTSIFTPLNSTTSSYLFCQEQGRRNDLLSKCDGPVPQDERSLLSTPACSTNIKSDSVHCGPLSYVASGSRCHTADYVKETKDVDASEPCLMYSLSKPPPPGSMCSSCANSSLRTQCAAAASADAHCPTVFHCRLCRARKKRGSPPSRNGCSPQSGKEFLCRN